MSDVMVHHIIFQGVWVSSKLLQNKSFLFIPNSSPKHSGGSRWSRCIHVFLCHLWLFKQHFDATVCSKFQLCWKKTCPTNIFQKSLKLPFPEYGTTSLSYLWCPYLNQQVSTANQLQGNCNIQMQPEKIHSLPETNSSHLKMYGWNTSFLVGRPWFPLIRPAIKPLFPDKGYIRGVRLTSHDNPIVILSTYKVPMPTSTSDASHPCPADQKRGVDEETKQRNVKLFLCKRFGRLPIFPHQTWSTGQHRGDKKSYLKEQPKNTPCRKDFASWVLAM